MFLINGFSGHGFQHSPAAGRVLADVIAGRDPRFDLAPFAADRFAASMTGVSSTSGPPGASSRAGERYFV
jgi:glycine/D-amino acid oxidase-like deaminating enzyme